MPQNCNASEVGFTSVIRYKGQRNLRVTERLCRVVNTPASHSGGPWLKFRPENRLSWLKFFVVFFSSSRQILE
jgi:hypothetical protein